MSLSLTRLLSILTPALLFSTSITPVLAQNQIDFEKQILPILDNACFKCHSAQSKKVKGDVRLDDVAEIRAKSRTDSLIFPHKSSKSLLFKVINLPAGDDDLMPPAEENKPLTPEQIALIRDWIKQGANFGDWKSAVPRPKQVDTDQEPINALDIAATAKKIDELVEAKLTGETKPNPPLADDLWCRRVYLDLIGRIPTCEEIIAFLNSKDPQKRAKLIDTLLTSTGHISTMFNYWCDALRARDQLNDFGTSYGKFYLHYIKDNIRTNKPYDRWAKELVGSHGQLDTPTTGFYVRDLDNRFASVDNMSILFLGTQIGCAQCHDHPFDQWSRKAYHQFAAWTSAVDTKNLLDLEKVIGKVKAPDVEVVREKLEKKGEQKTSVERRKLENTIALKKLDQVYNRIYSAEQTGFQVNSGAQARGTLPDNYQYPDGKAKEPIQPAVLFGKEPTPKPGQRPVDALTEWMTSPENPRFALTVANRMWTRLMGAPFAGPVDNIKDAEDTANPQLAWYLTRLMVATKYDLRQFQRILVNTRLYSRQAGTLPELGKPYDFVGPVLRRMSAEQAWDSLMTLAVPNLDTKISFEPPAPKEETEEDRRKASMNNAEDLMKYVEDFAKQEAEEKIKEEKEKERHPGRAKVWKKEWNKDEDDAPQMEFSEDELLRASELRQPSPEVHFLRVFGQSSREVIDASWRGGTVPQTLFMLNSTMFDVIAKRGSPLYNSMTKATGESARLYAVYLAILGRMPTLEESRLISSTLGGSGNIEAVAHTLLGTRQFLFIQ